MKSITKWFLIVALVPFILWTTGCSKKGKNPVTGMDTVQNNALVSDRELPEGLERKELVPEKPAGNVKARTVSLTLSGSGTAIMDGVLSSGEWDGAGTVDLSVNVPEGGTTPARLYVMNNSANLYLALRFARTVVDSGNSLVFEFDNDTDGLMEAGDDAIVYNPATARGLWDDFRTPCANYPNSLCGPLDIQYGGTNDGSGAFKNDGVYTVYEMSHPLNSGDTGHDFALSAGQKVGFILFLRMISAGAKWPAGYGDTYYPGWGTYAQIEITGVKNLPPVANAGADQTVLVGESVLCDGSGSTDSDESIVSYTWDFGDGATGSGVSVSHVYSTAGTYTVTLTVTDNAGATAQDTAVVTVLTPAQATQNLINLVQSMGLPDGISNALIAKLEAAISSLNSGNTQAAKGQLGAFINQVEALAGKKMTQEQAQQLVDGAKKILNNI